MKVLITGGAGYIGSHTIVELQSKNIYHPISVDNYINSSSKTYDRIEQITQRKPYFENIDLCNLAETKKIFSLHPDIQGIIHFAALKSVGDSVQSPLLYYRNNISSLLNILACVKEYNIKNVIFSSSCSVYGNIDSLPVDENTSQKPISPYAQTKSMGEQILKDFYSVNPSLSCVALRYFNPVGAHSSGKLGELPINKPNNLLPVICQAASTGTPMHIFGSNYNTRDGSCIRDYIHVTDIAKAHVYALEYLTGKKNKSNYTVFNLGSGHGVSVLEMIHAFEKFNHIKVPHEIFSRREGDVEAIYSNSQKAYDELGWACEKNLEDMVKSAWLWQQNISTS